MVITMKKFELIVAVLLIFILMPSCAGDNEGAYVVKGYDSCDEYRNNAGFGDYYEYSKYYYHHSYDAVFGQNSLYPEVSEDSVGKICEFFDDFQKWMILEGMKEYDFDTECITPGDFAYIETRQGKKIGDHEYTALEYYSVYLYDTESHTLYYIHNEK